MKHEEQLKAIEAVRPVLPSGVVLTPGENKYGHITVDIEYEDVVEHLVLEGYNKTWCAKAILTSYPVSCALR